MKNTLAVIRELAEQNKRQYPADWNDTNFHVDYAKSLWEHRTEDEEVRDLQQHITLEDYTVACKVDQ